ncbi:MAG: hypothetical protein Q9216_004023 [Gyalolechia sp. 2 TL-2023]
MSTPNPMEGSIEGAFSSPPPPVSNQTFTIAGISTTVYGLGELSSDVQDVACLWLLHPRLQTKACMENLAAAALHHWNKREECKRIGLLAVTFDQRNHGSREITPLANEAWHGGNELHAQDMFSIYHGAATDASLLMTYLSSYIFPESHRTIATNLVLGVSLGGHAAWQCIFHDPRISAAIIVIGCPDYFSLMSDRAQRSKRSSWLDDPRPGVHFVGSRDFPPGLVKSVELHDPAGMLLGKPDQPIRGPVNKNLSAVHDARLLPQLRRLLYGKRILSLSGGADKLVPYRCGEAFIEWLKYAAAPGNWFDGSVHLENIVYNDVGHQMTPRMVVEAIRFIQESLQSRLTVPVAKSSKL